MNISFIEKLSEINTLNEINLKPEVQKLKKDVFQDKVNNMNIIKKLMLLKNQKYDLNNIRNKLMESELNIQVNSLSEGIKKINAINLFKILDLKENTVEQLDIPLKYKKYQLSANSTEELEHKLNISNINNIIIEQCIEDNTIYTVYEIQPCYYRINLFIKS